jgi:hypothetical protein
MKNKLAIIMMIFIGSASANEWHYYEDTSIEGTSER